MGTYNLETRVKRSYYFWIVTIFSIFIMFQALGLELSMHYLI